MTILITGAGLVGSQIARLLIEDGERPVLFDLTPQHDALSDIVDTKRLTLVQGDLLNPLDLVRVIRESKITHIIHTAANPLLTTGAQRNPYPAIQINIMGTVNVLEAARAFGIERVVVTSSGVLSHYLVGGEDKGDPFKEEAYPRPSTFYSATKQAVENLGLSYARWLNVDFVAVRFAAVVGPWRGRGGGGGPSNIFRDLIEGSLGGKESVLPRRKMEWVYSKDAALGACLALRARGLKSRVFNIGSGQILTPEEVAATVTRVIPSARIRIEPLDPNAPKTDVDEPLDLTRSHSELGYSPKYDLEASVRDYVSWYQAHHSPQKAV
jgi:nucleoside-diphosphate-sugar epimerase